MTEIQAIRTCLNCCHCLDILAGPWIRLDWTATVQGLVVVAVVSFWLAQVDKIDDSSVCSAASNISVVVVQTGAEHLYFMCQ